MRPRLVVDRDAEEAPAELLTNGALLGGRVNRSDEDGLYTGFYVEDAPLLDLVHMLNELRRYDRFVPLIRALEQLVLEREGRFRQIFMDAAKVRAIFHDPPSPAPGHAMFCLL